MGTICFRMQAFQFHFLTASPPYVRAECRVNGFLNCPSKRNGPRFLSVYSVSIRVNFPCLPRPDCAEDNGGRERGKNNTIFSIRNKKICFYVRARDRKLIEIGTALSAGIKILRGIFHVRSRDTLCRATTPWYAVVSGWKKKLEGLVIPGAGRKRQRRFVSGNISSFLQKLISAVYPFHHTTHSPVPPFHPLFSSFFSHSSPERRKIRPSARNSYIYMRDKFSVFLSSGFEGCHFDTNPGIV